MTETNHRRGMRKSPKKHPDGLVVSGGGDMRGWDNKGRGNARDAAFAKAHEVSLHSDVSVASKAVGNDFTNGRRGMAKAVAGAKKFVRSRIRFHDKAETRRMAREAGKSTGSEAPEG